MVAVLPDDSDRRDPQGVVRPGRHEVHLDLGRVAEARDLAARHLHVVGGRIEAVSLMKLASPPAPRFGLRARTALTPLT